MRSTSFGLREVEALDVRIPAKESLGLNTECLPRPVVNSKSHDTRVSIPSFPSLYCMWIPNTDVSGISGRGCIQTFDW